MKKKRIICLKMILLCLVMVAFLVACSASTKPVAEPIAKQREASGITDLIADAVNGQVDAEVDISLGQGLEAQSLTTLVVPDADTPLVIEGSGTSKSGKDFKVIFYGPAADLDLLNFQGKMRLRAQASEIQGQQVLRGTALIVEDSGTQAKSLKTYPFIASGLTTQFAGPAAGTVFELRGQSSLRGVCGSSDISAIANLSGNGEAKGIMVGLFDQVPCQAGSSLSLSLQSQLHLTAIKTSMGNLLSGPGSMGGTVAGKESAFPVFSLMVKEELPESIGFVDVEAADGVRVLNAEAARALMSFDLKTGTLVFEELVGNLAGLQKGDVLVSTPRPLSPNGFLRRVQSIDTQGNQVTVTTTRAVLKDAIKKANISVKRSFTGADSLQAQAWQEGNLAYSHVDGSLSSQALSNQALSNQTLSQEIPISVSKVIFDQDDDESTTDDQIRVDGNILITPTVFLELNCSGLLCTKPDFLAKFDIEQSSDLTLSANLNWVEDKSIQIARIPLPPITALFIVFTPEIVVSINASGEINVGVEYSVGQAIDLEVGAEYTSASGWQAIASFNESFYHDPPTFSASIEAKAGLEIESRIMLYGMVGLSAGVEVFAEFLAGIPRDPAWELYLGLTGDVAAELDIIVSQEEASLSLFTERWPIAEADDNPPEITSLIASQTCSNGTVPRNALTGLVRLDANTDDPEEGKGKGRVEWSRVTPGSHSLIEFLGETVEGSKHTFDADLADGDHIIKAKAFDFSNNATEKLLEVDVVNGCTLGLAPTVEITTVPGPADFIQEGQAFTLEARTTGLSGSCCTISWLSEFGEDLGETNGSLTASVSERLHSLDHVFSEIRSQTITAMVESNGATATDSIQLRAIVQERRPVADLSPIAMETQDKTLYLYEDDSVSFSVSSSADLFWASSNPDDNLTRSGNSVSGQFSSSGPRTITVIARDDAGGFSSESYKVRVQSALARP